MVGARRGAWAAATVALLCAPATAPALDFTPCTPAGVGCATVRVLLDRTGALPGTVDLAVRRKPATSGTSAGALVSLTGGPGGAAIPGLAQDAALLAPALASRDLVVFDQRGVGLSGPILCRPGGAVIPGPRKRACAERLGPARALYHSRDSADDLEAVRQALGVERLAIAAVSYGAVVAYDYASRYPSHVEWLILDSPVPPRGLDALQRSAAAAAGRVLRSLCRLGCAGVTRDPVRDMAALAARLRRAPLSGRLVGADGRPALAALRSSDLWTATLESDLNPPLRAELPAAVRSALRGDPAPLLRVKSQYRRAFQAMGPRAADARSFNWTLNNVTLCEEGAFPWPRNAPPDAKLRGTAVDAALAAIPASTYAPFPPLSVLTGESTLATCFSWPHAPRTPQLDEAPAPDVPALVLAGEQDLRTPLSDAEALARRFPRGQLVIAEYSGHGVLGGSALATRPCVRAALARFLAGTPAAATCRAARTRFPPAPLAPTALARVAPARGLRGIAGRTLAAVIGTLDDAQYAFAAASNAAQPSGTLAMGGLRGGRVRGAGTRVRLDRVVYVPGVTVSGTFDLGRATASVRVAGAGAHGTVRLTRARLTGRLDGRRFSLPKPSRPIALTAGAR